MGFTNASQLREVFLSGGMGFLLGAYFDVFRLLRRLTRPTAVWVFIQDCLFFITSAVAVFLFALSVTGGQLRVYLFLGLCAGFSAYRVTVGAAVVTTVDWLLRWLTRLWQFLWRILTAPFRGLWHRLAPLRSHFSKKGKILPKKAKNIFKKGLQHSRHLLYNHRV